jgi:hypothetical protein
MAKKSDSTKPVESAGDWKGELLSRPRALITEAAPEMTEERKWVKPTNPAGVPTFSHNGLVCTCETYKRVVKMTFARWPRWRTPQGCSTPASRETPGAGDRLPRGRRGGRGGPEGAHPGGRGLSPNGALHDMGSPDFREQFTFVAGQLDRHGLAYLHVLDGLAVGFHDLGEPMSLAEFRKAFHGPLIGNCGYTKESAERAIADGHADLISFGRPYISNPDLVERFRNGWPLAEPDPTHWYSPTGEKGYTDSPAYEACRAGNA